MTRPRAARRRIPELLKEGVGVILDLEDSAMCVFDEDRTRRLKAEAREGLRLVAADFPPSSVSEAVVIRINTLGSPHFENDLTALAEWTRRGLPLHISLPKAESGDFVRWAASRISEACGRDALASMTPIIEVGAALDRIPEILAACPGNPERAYFGWYDYALDIGLWPIPPMNSELFWNVSRRVACAVNKAGARFSQTPAGHVADQGEMLKIKSMTRFICSGPAGISTLGRDQTECLTSHVEPAEMELISPTWPPAEARAFAVETIRLFEENTRRKRSFAVIGDRFIPPHEYLAAKAHLAADSVDR